MDIARQRRRLWIALGISGACVLVALAALAGYFVFHAGWMLLAFGAAIVAGFASHGWLMWGFWREGRT